MLKPNLIPIHASPQYDEDDSKAIYESIEGHAEELVVH